MGYLCSPIQLNVVSNFHWDLFSLIFELTEKFKKIADKDLILYEADYPRNRDLITPEKLELTNKLKEKYNVRGFPTLVFVDHQGVEIKCNKGLLITEYYYPIIQSVIDQY